MNQKIQISFQKNNFLEFEKLIKLSYKVFFKIIKNNKMKKGCILPVFAVVWNKTDTFSFKVSV